MAKVFLAFFNGIKGANDPNAMPIFYEAFIKGLKDNGNDVFAITHADWNATFLNEEIPESLLEDIKLFNPDIIFLFNNNFYDLSKYFDCPIIIYEVDSPIYYRNKEVLKAKPDRFNYFVAASSSIDIIHNEMGAPKENVIQVPFFTEVYAENVEKKHNICFIGSKVYTSGKKCTNNFMELNPTDEERKEFLKLIETLQENVFISDEELLKNTTSEKILSTFSSQYLIYYLSDYKRTKVLSNVADLGIDIWGTPNWATETYNEPWLILNFHKDSVYSIRHNQDIYNSSKIGINIGHLQAKNGFPWRVFDIMASNACLVTEYHGDFDKYLPKLKLPYFSNAWEAREICKKLLEDENYRLDIVAQSQEIINKNYRFANILTTMESFLGISIKNKEIRLKDKICSRVSKLDDYLETKKEINLCFKDKLNFINKIRYKIYKHYSKILTRKGII